MPKTPPQGPPDPPTTPTLPPGARNHPVPLDATQGLGDFFPFPVGELDAEGVDADEDPENADWIRSEWPWPAIQNVARLKEQLAKFDMTLEHFKTLPVYQFNVAKMPWLQRI